MPSRNEIRQLCKDKLLCINHRSGLSTHPGSRHLEQFKVLHVLYYCSAATGYLSAAEWQMQSREYSAPQIN